GAAVSNPVISAVYVTTITVAWSTAPSNGYMVDASTASDFTGTLFSTATTINSVGSLVVGSVAPLAANTTYYLRVGALYGATTFYATTVPISTSTLTSYLTGAQFAGVSSFTVTANWLPFTSGSGTNKSEGYQLQASTASDFSVIAGSSRTTDTTV